MQVDLLTRPGAAVARVNLQAGETLSAVAGAMVAMQGPVTVETSSKSKGGGGGLMKGLRRMLAGESMFLNHFTASGPSFVMLAPSLPGDVLAHELRQGTLVVQGSGWLGSSASIDVDASFAGFSKALLSGESMFWVKLTGAGTVLLSSFGGIFTVDVDGEHIVDTGNIVAFEDTLTYDVHRAEKSLFGSFMGGEGFVCHFKGRGRLWCQTHQPEQFGRELTPLLSARQG